MKTISKLIRTFAVSLCLFLAFGCSDDEKTNDPNSPVVVNRFYPTSGGIGTEIIITGRNFSERVSDIEVTVSGRRLPVIGADMNNIVVVVPAKMGSGRLEVKVADHDPVQTVEEFLYTYSAVVTTLAGNGEEGYADGEGADALFHFNDYVPNPEGWRHGSLATDAEGNVYVGDTQNSVIRKITPEGEVTTLAGRAGSPGSVDGNGSSARINPVYGIARDLDGSLVFTDVNEFKIRKVTTSGNVTTLGSTSFEPWFIAVDPTTGNYFVAGKNDWAIYQWSPSQTMQIASNIFVNGLAFDSAGNLYATCASTHKVVRYDAGTWNRTDLAGSGAEGNENGAFPLASFYFPAALAVDSNGDVYVAGDGTWDGGGWGTDQSIRRLDMTAREVVTVAGSSAAGFVDGNGAAAAFRGPQFLALDDEGMIYVFDKMNNAVRKIVYE